LDGYDKEVNSLDLLPKIPSPLHESSGAALEWPRLRGHIADRTFSPLGRAWILALEPCADFDWIDQQQQRTAELRRMLVGGGSFDFRGLFDPTAALEMAQIDGAALESIQIRDLLEVVERVAAWRNLVDPAPGSTRYEWPAIADLSAPLLD
jgi:DNA mismatch repair protein MutS2